MTEFDEEVLEDLLRNPHNSLRKQEIIEISNKSISVVTIYPTDRYAEFHGEFTQTASIIPELRPLVDYLFTMEYRTNLD